MKFTLYGMFPVDAEFMAVRAFLEWQSIRHLPVLNEGEVLKRGNGKRVPVLHIENGDASTNIVGYFAIVEKIKELGLCIL